MTTNAGTARWGGRSMARSRRVIAAVALLFLGAIERPGAAGADEGEILVVRLVHPDRQAAAILRLFDGEPVPHPAAALALWKAAAPLRNLGKPLEAAITLFNPEMTSEWRMMDDARLSLNWDKAAGRFGWHAAIPRMMARSRRQSQPGGSLTVPP